MNDNRRLHESSGLRTFFDEQVHHLQALLGDLGSPISDEPQTDKENQIIECFVDATNSKMRAAHDYVEKLRPHVCMLYEHVLQVAAQIPAPVDLKPDTFRTSPLVNSLFVNGEDIDRLFRNDHDARAYLRSHSPDQVPIVYALLTACKREKSVLGVGMLGDMLVRDVPHETVNFSSHKIHTLCDSSTALSVALKRYLFDHVVHLIKQELASRAAAQALNPSDHSYESRVHSLANPDVYLNTLIEFLQTPPHLLDIDKCHFKLNKLGIKVECDDEQCTNEFDIHELTWSDKSRDIVVQVAYAR
ncbi:MAG: hypothetical protein ACXV7J_13030 [Methylomonas sp.]